MLSETSALSFFTSTSFFTSPFSATGFVSELALLFSAFGRSSRNFSSTSPSTSWKRAKFFSETVIDVRLSDEKRVCKRASAHEKEEVDRPR